MATSESLNEGTAGKQFWDLFAIFKRGPVHTVAPAYGKGGRRSESPLFLQWDPNFWKWDPILGTGTQVLQMGPYLADGIRRVGGAA